MNIRFTKMQGAGNDFVVINALAEPFALSPAQIKQLADRHFGIGCDQLLVVEKATRPEADFRYRIFNADGGEVEQCGNGARCFVRFVHDEGLTTQRQIRVETLSGIISPRLEDNGQVTVDMGQPRFLPDEIPFISDSQAVIQTLQVGEAAVGITVVSMGNPHAVQVVADIDTAMLETLGPRIESHPRFPQRVNAGFMQVVDVHTIRLRVYERGAGETLACGTGACAAVVAGMRRGLLVSPVRVITRGGDLSIAWDGQGSVLLTGPAVSVFNGEIKLSDV
ncbi:MAG TPA: diaminopimelate epimerase [Rugosibacter sp.]|jgi:diaminopimelate epimerase|nr:diaminopimelate epimerase [Rugosibacter sp.]HQN46970.1 diaminopimelate epimerase [Rugosibacter sp.]HQQ35126.1 diaminopimelate epimerase [Rugosibacter sp.]